MIRHIGVNRKLQTLRLTITSHYYTITSAPPSVYFFSNTISGTVPPLFACCLCLYFSHPLFGSVTLIHSNCEIGLIFVPLPTSPASFSLLSTPFSSSRSPGTRSNSIISFKPRGGGGVGGKHKERCSFDALACGN